MSDEPPTPSYVSDECVNAGMITRMHQRFGRRPVPKLLGSMIERDPALYSYVLVAAETAKSMVEDAGLADPIILQRLMEEVALRMIVALESQRQAQYELWREFMGDDADEGGTNE